MKLTVSVRIGGTIHTTENPIKEALLMRVQELDRLLELAETITKQDEIADKLMKMSEKSNRCGYRLLGSECVSLVASDELFCETHKTRQWPESVQRLLDIVKVRRETCLAAALKIQ